MSELLQHVINREIDALTADVSDTQDRAALEAIVFRHYQDRVRQIHNDAARVPVEAEAASA